MDKKKRRGRALPSRFPYPLRNGVVAFLLTALTLNTYNTYLDLKKSQAITMVTGKRLADMGYRAFSASMMLLTLYGGYLCSMRAYRYMQRQKELKMAAENQDPEMMKD